jgi:hypothetical protein
LPPSKLDEIVEEIRSLAEADFAFVLTRRGRLITVEAPQDMPEAGRMRLTKAAKPLLGTTQTVQLTLARQDLVPYGGAAPVDVYLAVAREQAILCVVMSTWADKRPIIPAMLEGIALLEPVLDRKQGGGIPAAAGRARSPTRVAPRTSPPPPGLTITAPSRPPTRAPAAPTKSRRRGAMSGLVGLIGGVPTASSSLEKAPVIQNAPTPAPPRGESIPDIRVGEAALGRESLAAIERELHGSSLPDIVVGEGRLGLASLEAIDAASRAPVASAPDHVRVELTSMSRGSVDDITRAEAELAAREAAGVLAPDEEARSPRMTNPWAEAPLDSKRAVEAAKRTRGALPPRVTLKLEALDEDFEASLVEELDAIVNPAAAPEPLFESPPPEPDPAAAPPIPEGGGAASPRNPRASYEIWREALTAQLDRDPPRRKTR